MPRPSRWPAVVETSVPTSTSTPAWYPSQGLASALLWSVMATNCRPASRAAAITSSGVAAPSERVVWTWTTPGTRTKPSRGDCPTSARGRHSATRRATARRTRPAAASRRRERETVRGTLLPQEAAQGVRLVGALPGELLLAAPEVAVGGRLLVDGAPEVQVLDDALGGEGEDLAHGLHQPGLLDLARAEGVG